MNARLSSARLMAGIAVAGLILTGCAAGTDTSAGTAAPGGSSASAAQGEQNDADLAFVQGMIPHHRQAVEMADLVAGRSQNAQVIDLAARIGGGQQPEIDTMVGWLEEWGAEVPAEDGGMGGMGGMDHGGDMGAMGGMMTPEQMQQLQGASGPAFDRMFLEMMTEHHRGAVEMAQTELQDGADPDALALAQKIIDTQQAEITEMDTLLQQV
ncbi:hypothetical protein GCM10017691_19120 [Pseudonocardia petroleophila]|uniref:DUF305 domain-containing protein n=2 Tax=Pseudonocardia petroleophila TaxID=37331 RepID=A0A7G7MT19_9PSEU|nr:DUF305 domain-containing protein [Pseudonocardia petroleophila]